MKFRALISLFLISAVTIGDVRSQNSDAGSTQKSQIPPWLVETFGPDFNLDTPSVYEGEHTLKEMCEKNGPTGSYEAVVQAKEELHQCFSFLKKYPELPSRIRNASKSGEVDSVFMEYCNDSSYLKGCVNKFLFALEPCLAEEEKFNKYILHNITESVFDFICDGQGNNIAVFYTEQGLDCIMSRKVGLQKCLNQTVGQRDSNTTEGNGLFTLKFNLEQCKSLVQLRKCVTSELITCTRTTAANVVDSILKLIQSSTPCSTFTSKELGDEDKSKGLRYHHVATSILLPMITVLLARNFK